MSAMQIEPGTHACAKPKGINCPGDLTRVHVDWRCPVCGQRWEGTIYPSGDSSWGPHGLASRRWRKQRRIELQKLVEAEQ